MMQCIVLKIGGSELAPMLHDSQDPFVCTLAEQIMILRQEYQVVLVHGGGKTVADLQNKLGLTPRMVDGLRVTDKASLDVAEMALSGLVNKRLTARLVTAGIPAVGLSGVDGGLIRVSKMSHPDGDLGLVGKVVDTTSTAMTALLDAGMMPIISPISLGLDDQTYNVNADHVAAALAGALQAVELVFVSNVPGVLTRSDDPACTESSCVDLLTPKQVEALISSGEIYGGMVPKVRSALRALAHGVARVRIVDLPGLALGKGTCFQNQ